MPPWFANPEYGHCLNERRLTDAEIQTLVSWVDAGAPEGDPKSKPARVKWITGWNINPDAVFETKPIPVPAQGVLDYMYIVIPTYFDTDTWITGGEIRPSDRSVVHHISAFWRPAGSMAERRQPSPRNQRYSPGVIRCAVEVPLSMIQTPPDLPFSGSPSVCWVAPGTAMVI